MISQVSDKTKITGRGWLRWFVVGLVVVLIVLYVIVESTWLRQLSRDARIAVDILILAALSLLALAAFDRWRRSERERLRLGDRLAHIEEQLAQAYQRQSAVIRISQLFTEAQAEDEVIELVMRYAMDLLKARGVSFVPIDEHAQPQSAVTLGDLPVPLDNTWMEYLASPAVRQTCASCQNQDQLTHNCPLLSESPLEASGIYCLPIRRGEQDYGMLNVYIPVEVELDNESQSFLRTLIDETALALESVRMRKRTMSTLRQLQAARERADLNSLLDDLLRELPDTLDADYALVTIWDREAERVANSASSGDLPEKSQHLVEGVVRSVITSKEPVLLGNVSGDAVSSPGVRALMAVPLIAQDQPSFGAILVANTRPKRFNQSQLTVLQTIAGQVALVVHNTNLLSQLEYNTIVQERTRLAREIHDGLAQTLGFLKLRVAQMRNYIEQGDIDTVRNTLDGCYTTLAEAYEDARQAIDGLRITPSEAGISGWLHQTASEFEEMTEIKVIIVEPVAKVDLPPEVHVQLIRIVQEALSNIRKHASAHTIYISCAEVRGEVILEVRDDGVGFSPQDVTGPSRHGLRGMRERAELIRADFQVIGLPKQGTTIRVSLPLDMKESER